MSMIKFGSSDYPARLGKLHDPPKRLFIEGKLPDFSRPVITIIGSRKATAYGSAVAQMLSFELASAGVHVVSGLALGIDGLAHQSALKSGGLTSAVLPCGLDEIYPASHRSLAKHIVEGGGALISEYPPGTRPAAYHFPARNRIEAALADALLVIEAGEKSGTMITVEHALDIGVPVLAVPGPITSALSVGTNRIIKNGAALVSSTTDVLAELGLENVASTTHLATDSTEQLILDHLSRTFQATTDELALACGLNNHEINRRLTHLELAGTIRVQGGWWVLA